MPTAQAIASAPRALRTLWVPRNRHPPLPSRRTLDPTTHGYSPGQAGRARWEVFEASGRALLVPLATRSEGWAEREVRVSSTALVHVDRNRYSVDCRYAGKTVSLRTYADRIVTVADGNLVSAT